jgi:alkaline phosphatase D
VFFQTSWGDVDLFFLDERYHRSPDRAPDDERKQMLGEEQFRWLERGLAASKATFKIVAGGSTLDASETDGWRLYSHARRRLFRALASTDGAIFVSGDVHRSFVTRFPPSVTGGHAIYEIVSSGVALGSPFLPDSFVTISIDTTARDPVIVAQVTRLGAEGEPPRRSRTVIRRSELQAH